MSIDVTVLRVFTDSDGNFGNPLGVVDAGLVEPADRQRLAAQLGYSETIFVDLPADGAHDRAGHHPYSPHRTALRRPPDDRSIVVVARAGHADQHAVGAGRPRAGQLSRAISPRSAHRAQWAPDFAVHDLDSPQAVDAADPVDFPDDVAHYLWAWTDREAGSVRARMFAANLGVAEDEATGSAAIRITEYLSRDLVITQGNGSMIHTTWSPEGWVRVAGRVVNDGLKQVD